MPELPEAETIGRALDQALSGRSIVKVEVFSPAMRSPLTPLLHAGVEGGTFIKVRRRGRYLMAYITGNRCFLMHFGMSGVVRIEPPTVARRKHEHLFIHLSDGNIFRFECTRRFSLFELHECAVDAVPQAIAHLGVEPLSGEFTGRYFFEKCRKRPAPVKNLLMDNLIVTGIGNIYAAETLFASGIDPRRPGNKLALSECDKIVENARQILLKSIETGGTTISDFRHVDGSEGKFVLNLKVYGKDGEKCPVCGRVIECVKLGGRSSCFCPGCQK